MPESPDDTRGARTCVAARHRERVRIVCGLRRSLADAIRSKEAAGREKGRAVLPVLAKSSNGREGARPPERGPLSRERPT